MAAIIVILAAGFIESKGIDDPVGAIAVHGVGGIFGVIATGLFANGNHGAGWTGSDSEGEGLLYGDAGQLGAQLVGVVVLVTVIFGIAFGFFKLQNKYTKGGIRSAEADEIMGLDIPELGVQAYPEFDMLVEDYEKTHTHADGGLSRSRNNVEIWVAYVPSSCSQ